MTQELSGVTVVVFIACGVLTFILLFIFAKRQIMRFALRSRRGPHVPIGHDAKKSLKKEIERRIDVIPRIIYEPQLLNNNDSQYIINKGDSVPPYYYRLKAVDDVKLLEKEICKQDPTLRRHPAENLRSYLIHTLGGPLNGMCQKLVHQFCDMYEHARHDPSEFGDEEYEVYSKLLLKLMDAAKTMKSFPNSRRSSPSKTPIRKCIDKGVRKGLMEAKLKSAKSFAVEAENESSCVNDRDINSLERPTSLTIDNNESNELKHETTV
ncbi:protein C1orf43 homolog [Ischnura elegans]|uniref:protein C1orf43 homolog n=1 Tax=Ischnura elegans TaxID=197161 RepID=UPI001ED8BCE1|nr:protein C1orf43 homolog [Ischnura elegans]